MKKIILFLLLITLLITACDSVSKEEAIEITQEFVNSNVKFYVNQNETAPTVNRAAIRIDDIKKLDYTAEGKNIPSWNVFLNVKSNQTGELKQTDLLIIINAKNGEIITWGKI